MDMPPQATPERPPNERPSARPITTRPLFGILAVVIGVIIIGAFVGVLGMRFVAIGSGTSKTESRAISNVSQVSLGGSGTLIIRQGESESLTVTTDDNLLSSVETTVSNGRLTLGQRSFGVFIPRVPLLFNLTVKDLNAVEISGSGTASATQFHTSSLRLEVSGSGTLTFSGLDVTTLNATISGSGEISTSGQAQSQTIDVSGSGTYAASDLASTTARAEVSGSGDIAVQVSGSLDATISGSGNVTYTGNPATVTKHISGSGEITKG